jgi:hypothetical protein
LLRRSDMFIALPPLSLSRAPQEHNRHAFDIALQPERAA